MKYKPDQQNLVFECHSIALAYLRMKANRKRIYQFHGEKLEDLAWDFIADLFQRDQHGNFSIIDDYFSRLQSCDEEEFQMHLTKLVFTKVDDALFRVVGEQDPSLRKIIRNLKLAVKQSKLEEEISCEHGWLILSGSNSTLSFNDSTDTVPYDLMFIWLSNRVDYNMKIPEILHQVVSLLDEQTEYKKSYSLTGLALLIRDMFVSLNTSEVPENSFSDAEEEISYRELDTLIKGTKQVIFNETVKGYLQRKGLTEEKLKQFLDAAENIIK